MSRLVETTSEPLKRNYRRASTVIENRLTNPSILGCSINYFWIVHPDSQPAESGTQGEFIRRGFNLSEPSSRGAPPDAAAARTRASYVAFSPDEPAPAASLPAVI